VTIATGFKCIDGIVLSSDTELTHGDALKLNQGKLTIFDGYNFKAAMTGAGEWEYIKMAFERILDEFMRLQSESETPRISSHEVRRIVESTVLNIYKRHIRFSPQEPKPGFWLLVGVETPDETFLIKSADTAIRKSDGFECIGTGSALGNYLADMLYQPFMSVREGIFLTIYILRLAKKYVPYVGGRSSIVVLTPEGIRVPAVVGDIEAAFDEVEALIRPLLFQAVDRLITDEEFKNRSNLMIDILQRIRGAVPLLRF
jgi:20S proteasome alpha/beta subunit